MEPGPRFAPDPATLLALSRLATTTISLNRRWRARLIHQSRIGRQLEEREAEVAKLREALERQERVATMGKPAASIAHEVNNPMSHVLSNLHEAQKETRELTSALHDLVRLALMAARAVGLGRPAYRASLRRVRRFAHGLPDAFDMADVQAIIETAIQVVDVATWRRIELIRRFAEELPEIRCQRHHITQILLNLLLNATAALGEAVSIEIRTRSTESWIEIEITDDGPGVAVDRRERIFDSFYTTREHGNGVGLSISRDIARAHGGTLELIGSAVGACVLLRLPIAGP